MNPDSITSLALHTIQSVIEAENAFANVANRFKVTEVVDVDCRELVLKLKVALATVLQWREIWFVESDKSDDFFSTLWGKAGRQQIHALLVSISRDSNAIRELAHESTELSDNLVKKHNIKRANKPRHWPKWLRLNLKTQLDKALDKRVRDNVLTLSANIDSLWASSELHFRSLHGMHHGSSLDTSHPLPQALLGKIMDSRQASTSLYWHCQNRNIDLDLDMNLLNNDGEIDKLPDLFDWSDLRISYHFIGNSSDPVRLGDVFIEAGAATPDPMSNDPIPDAVFRSTLEEAFQQTCTEQTVCLPALPTAPKLCVQSMYRADMVQSRKELQALPVFAAELEDTHVPESKRRVSIAEKMSLAYRLVECALFLLGTPWLSHLSCNSLRRTKASGTEYQYSLHVQWHSNSHPAQFAQDHLERWQLFRVGILLIEIALETRLPMVNSHNFQSSMIPSIEDFMGPQYAQACEFCLIHRKGGEVERASDSASMLQEYYSEVFIPLRDKHNSI